MTMMTDDIDDGGSDGGAEDDGEEERSKGDHIRELVEGDSCSWRQDI